jgi:hypothetical protein
VVDDAPACSGSINDPHPEPLDGGLLGCADPRHPPAIRPDSANAPSFVEATTVILPASGPMRPIADENTSMSMSGAAIGATSRQGRSSCCAQVGTSAKREHAAEARKPAEKCAAGHNSFGLHQMSDDHTEPSGTLPATDPLPASS